MATTVPITVVSLQQRTEEIFTSLMVKATDNSSIYKVVLDKIIDDTFASSTSADFSTSERVKVIAEIAGRVVAPITNQAMQTAYSMAKEDRDATYSYPDAIASVGIKDEQINKLIKEVEIADQNKDKLAHDNLLAQASLKRDFGVTNSWATTLPTDLTLGSTGTKLRQEEAAQAQVYTMYAKAHREYGKIAVDVKSSGTYMAPIATAEFYGTELGIRQWVYTVYTDNTGSVVDSTYDSIDYYVEGTTTEDQARSLAHDDALARTTALGGTAYFNSTITGVPIENSAEQVKAGLVANQTKVQNRQYQAFDDNKAQHAANSLSNMVSALASTEFADAATAEARSKYYQSINVLVPSINA